MRILSTTPLMLRTQARHLGSKSMKKPPSVELTERSFNTVKAKRNYPGVTEINSLPITVRMGKRGEIIIQTKRGGLLSGFKRPELPAYEALIRSLPWRSKEAANTIEAPARSFIRVGDETFFVESGEWCRTGKKYITKPRLLPAALLESSQEKNPDIAAVYLKEISEGKRVFTIHSLNIGNSRYLFEAWRLTDADGVENHGYGDNYDVTVHGELAVKSQLSGSLLYWVSYNEKDNRIESKPSDWTEINDTYSGGQ